MSELQTLMAEAKAKTEAAAQALEAELKELWNKFHTELNDLLGKAEAQADKVEDKAEAGIKAEADKVLAPDASADPAAQAADTAAQ